MSKSAVYAGLGQGLMALGQGASRALEVTAIEKMRQENLNRNWARQDALRQDDIARQDAIRKEDMARQDEIRQDEVAFRNQRAVVGDTLQSQRIANDKQRLDQQAEYQTGLMQWRNQRDLNSNETKEKPLDKATEVQLKALSDAYREAASLNDDETANEILQKIRSLTGSRNTINSDPLGLNSNNNNDNDPLGLLK